MKRGSFFHLFRRDFFENERRFLRDVFVPHKTEKNVRFLPTRGHTARYAPTAPPSSIRVLWLCKIVETSARGAPQSNVKLHVKRDTPPISANFMKFQQLFLIGKFYTEFHEILRPSQFMRPAR